MGLHFDDDGMRAEAEAWAGSASPQVGAMGANLRCEERVAEARRKAYEGLAGAGSLTGRHKRYLGNAISVERGRVPDTFQPTNDLALTPAIEGNQRLVRVENLGFWVDELGFAGDRPGFLHRFAALKTASGGAEGPQAAMLLGKFFAEWNEKRDARPMFAAFRDELQAEIAAPDWGRFLPARLGIVFPNPPLLLGLMVYRVAEVLGACPEADHGRCFAAPTVLDRHFDPLFHPAPHTAPPRQGAPLDLTGKAAGLVAEVLHRHIPYTLGHLVAVQEVVDPVGEGDLDALRARHMGLLRGGRPGFCA
ncbi:MAG: hypothetical protein H7841_02040 [Magnetospirillum sp. WYHS-4]